MRAVIGCGISKNAASGFRRAGLRCVQLQASGVGHRVRFHQHGRKFVEPVGPWAAIVPGCRGRRRCRYRPEAADQQHVTDLVAQGAAVDGIARRRRARRQCGVDAGLELRLIEIGHLRPQLALQRRPLQGAAPLCIEPGQLPHGAGAGQRLPVRPGNGPPRTRGDECAVRRDGRSRSGSSGPRVRRLPPAACRRRAWHRRTRPGPTPRRPARVCRGGRGQSVSCAAAAVAAQVNSNPAASRFQSFMSIPVERSNREHGRGAGSTERLVRHGRHAAVCRVPRGAQRQSRTTLPDLPDSIRSKPFWNSSAGNWWLSTLPSGKPDSTSWVILYQVSYILRP